jgi:hypothetical protein
MLLWWLHYVRFIYKVTRTFILLHIPKQIVLDGLLNRNTLENAIFSVLLGLTVLCIFGVVTVINS